MLYREKELPEIFFLKHRHDTEYTMDYENKLLDKTVSPYLFNNDTMNSFLKQLQKLMHLFFDKFNVVRNFKNPTVDKYEYRHPN